MIFLTKTINKQKSLTKVIQIAEHEGDDLHKTFDHDELLLGFQFLGDMVNRLFFMLLVIAEVIAFSSTILPTVQSGSSEGAQLETVRLLELEACGGNC